MKFHIHKWKEFARVDVHKTKPTDYLEAVYRYCDRCKKWQRAHWYNGLFFTEIIWEDSYVPRDVESLITYEECAKNIKKLQMEKEAGFW